MKRENHETNIQHLYFQRNVSLAISFLLAGSLIVVCSLLIFKSEKIVIVPYGFEKDVWVRGGRVSKSYLERQGEIIANFLLNKNSTTAPKQREFLLTLAAPDFFGSFRKKLLEEENLLSQQGVSFSFLPIEISSDEENLKVFITGDRFSYLGEKKIDTKREKYTFIFKHNGQALLLSGIEREEVKRA